jgi:hypothetical protein
MLIAVAQDTLCLLGGGGGVVELTQDVTGKGLELLRILEIMGGVWN